MNDKDGRFANPQRFNNLFCVVTNANNAIGLVAGDAGKRFLEIIPGAKFGAVPDDEPGGFAEKR